MKGGKFHITYIKDRDHPDEWLRILRPDGTVESDQPLPKPLTPPPTLPPPVWTEQQIKEGQRFQERTLARPADADDAERVSWDTISGTFGFGPTYVVLTFPFRDVSPNQQAKLYFNQIDPRTKRQIAKAEVGPPGAIMGAMPVCSTAKQIGNELWLAWIWESNPKIENDIYSSDTALVLSRWKPGEKSVLHFPIRKTDGSNCALSMGELDGKFLVAWHEWGKVRTEIVDTTKASFAPVLKLPLRAPVPFAPPSLK